MRTSRFSVEQIALALRQVDAGTPVGEICRKLEIAEATIMLDPTAATERNASAQASSGRLCG